MTPTNYLQQLGMPENTANSSEIAFDLHYSGARVETYYLAGATDAEAEFILSTGGRITDPTTGAITHMRPANIAIAANVLHSYAIRGGNVSNRTMVAKTASNSEPATEGATEAFLNNLVDIQNSVFERGRFAYKDVRKIFSQFTATGAAIEFPAYQMLAPGDTVTLTGGGDVTIVSVEEEGYRYTLSAVPPGASLTYLHDFGVGRIRLVPPFSLRKFPNY